MHGYIPGCKYIVNNSWVKTNEIRSKQSTMWAVIPVFNISTILKQKQICALFSRTFLSLWFTTAFKIICLLAHHKCKLSLTDQTLAHVSLRIHFADTKPLVELGDINPHHEHITRHDRLAPFAVIHTAKEEVVLLGSLRRVNHDNTAELSKGLNLENTCINKINTKRVGQKIQRREVGGGGVSITWHDGTLREMAREEVIVDCDTLVSYCALAIFPLQDTIDQQKWVPMRSEWG